MLLLALLLSLTLAVSPVDFKIYRLPYYSGTLPEMYSGFLDTGDSSKNLFFWFFVNKEEKTSTTFPVMLWLNGGPGISSMMGLFNENGPFNIDEDSSGKPMFTDIQHTWCNSAHMLYVDQPVGTGFSYSTNSSNYVTSD